MRPILMALGLAILAGALSAQDWPAYGRDPGGSRYSPLKQINRQNVARLKVAWTYHTGEVVKIESAFEATPIVVDGTLYFSTPANRVIALDPQSGAERWSFDPKIDVSSPYGNQLISRGVAAWLDAKGKLGRPCRRRIFMGTNDARLIALDAATGKPCEDFGAHGQVDLKTGVGLVRGHDYQVTSPPAVIADLVVVGSAIGDNQLLEDSRGVVRAYDARSGALRWSWDPVPRHSGDPGSDTWKGEKALRTGAANAWSIISADPKRGLLFVPTSSPSPDFYGGERKGSNRYADSVVALGAETGKPVWDFQVVHHDVWDYDVPAQPALVTVRQGGKNVPAVVVTTKMGHIFMLQRETGRPLLPVEERKVPQGGVEGEELSPTQPFPTAPPPLGHQKLSAEEAWGLTPADREFCRERIQALRWEGVFTPPSLEGSIIFPGNIGGSNWSGMAFDPERGLLVLNTNRVATIVTLIPRDKYAAFKAAHHDAEISPMAGTPYGMWRDWLLSPARAPCTAPPWGTLVAIELAGGKLRWEVPLGTMPELAAFPEASQWGSVNLGGAIVTAGGVVFIAAARDTYLRAFDTETGSELWKGELPASGQATPMTYSVSKKQFVVIAAGGHARLGTKRGDSVVAFALP